MSGRTIRGKTAIAGVGETTYYKHGQSPDSELVLVLKAILAACEDAGISPTEIDGFTSYSNDRNKPTRLAAALGIDELSLLKGITRAAVSQLTGGRVIRTREVLKDLKSLGKGA